MTADPARDRIAKRFRQFFQLHLTGPESGFQPEELADIAVEEFAKGQQANADQMVYGVSISRGKNGRGKPRCVVHEYGDDGFSTSRFICEAANATVGRRIANALHGAPERETTDRNALLNLMEKAYKEPPIDDLEPDLEIGCRMSVVLDALLKRFEIRRRG